MPITLVTGLPGHGKTLYTLARWKDEATKAGRPVFHNGIKGLNIPGWQEWKVEEWQQLPAGALMVVDEAQFPFPVRGRGEPPEWINKLATHRHLGLDFIVITQNPMLIDAFVRRLVDRHFHVVRRFGTHWATIHEFANGAKENVATSRDGSIRHDFKYPKDVFELYQSAELHTVKRRIPARVWMLLVLPVLFAGLAGTAWYRMRPEFAAEQARKSLGDQAVTPHAGGAPAERRPITPAEYAAEYSPRVAGLAHTAPVYDEVTKPTQAPYPAACLATKVKCGCYSQQATKLEVPDDLCRRIADGGFFVAWQQQVVNAVPIQPPAQQHGQQPPALPQGGPITVPAMPAPQVVAEAPMEQVRAFRRAAR